MNRARVALLLFALGAVAILALVAPALGSDQPTVVYPDEEVVETAPGETVEVDVMVRSDGGYNDVGLTWVKLVASYDEQYVEAVDVEAASWLEQGEPTDVFTETDVDPETGTVTVEQWRDPPEGGAIGDERFATLALEIADDAPETNVTVSFGNSEATLVDDYLVTVFAQNVTLVVDENAAGADSRDHTTPWRVAAGAGVALSVVALAALWRRRT